MERNGVANTVIWLRKKCFASLNLELQQIECALRYDANDLYVMADSGQIPIVRSNIIISRTPNLNITLL